MSPYLKALYVFRMSNACRGGGISGCPEPKEMSVSSPFPMKKAGPGMSAIVLQNLVDEPSQNREQDRAKKRGQESSHDKTRNDECHRPKEKRVQDKREDPERNDSDGKRKDAKHWLDDCHDHGPHERDKEDRRPSARNRDPRDERYGQVYRRHGAEKFQDRVHINRLQVSGYRFQWINAIIHFTT